MVTALILTGFAILLLAFFGAVMLAGQVLSGFFRILTQPRSPSRD